MKPNQKKKGTSLGQALGIAVLRLPKQRSHQDLIDAITTLILALKQDDITRKLWIVQRGTIRIYQVEFNTKPNKPTGYI